MDIVCKMNNAHLEDKKDMEEVVLHLKGTHCLRKNADTAIASLVEAGWQCLWALRRQAAALERQFAGCSRDCSNLSRAVI